MANDQRDMNTGNQDQSRQGMGNQSSDSSMGSHPGMGNADSGMGGAQRGSGNPNQQNTSNTGNTGNQGGLGADRLTDDDDVNVEGGDAGRGSSNSGGSSRSTGGDTGGMSGARNGEGGM